MIYSTSRNARSIVGKLPIRLQIASTSIRRQQQHDCRSRQILPSLIQQCFSSVGYDDDRRSKNNTNQYSSIYIQSPITPFVLQHDRTATSIIRSERRFHSTATITTSKQQQQQQQKQDSNVNKQPNDKVESTTDGNTTTLRERAGNYYRDRADHYRDEAVHYRDEARKNYREFRKHPRQSARDGAKSVGAMVRKYGPIFIGTYMTVYVTTLSTLFVGVQTGILDPVNLFTMIGNTAGDGETASTVQYVVDFMNKHTITKPCTHLIEKNPHFANLAVAWIAVKFTEPIRLPVSIYFTPKVARYFGYNENKIDEESEEEVKEGGHNNIHNEKDLNKKL